MPTDQKAERIKEIRRNLEMHDTQYLVNIWKMNNRDAWVPEAFDVIHEILLARLGNVPLQNEIYSSEAMKPRKGKSRLFLTSFEGEIEFQSLTVEDARNIRGRIHEALAKENASNIDLLNNKVAFQVNFFRFGFNWNILVPVDKGEIIVRPGVPGVIKYTFSILRSVVVTTIELGFVCLIFLPHIPDESLKFFIAYLICFIFYYITTIIRLQNFVWRAVSQ